MRKITIMGMNLKRTMNTMSFKIVSGFMLITVIFLASSCNKDLKGPTPFAFEIGVLSSSKNKVVVDAVNNPDTEAVSFSWSSFKNTLIKDILIVTSGSKVDTIAPPQNTVKKVFTNSELNKILIDYFGMTVGVTSDLTTKLVSTNTTTGETLTSNSVTIQVTPSESIIIPSNLIRGGTFETAADQNKWYILDLGDSVKLSFVNGKVQWTGGSWMQKGIYQSIEVEANKSYQLDFDITGTGMSDSWFEVYVGTDEPLAGQDYFSGGTRLGLNTWNGCGGAAFNGKMTKVACTGSDRGVVSFQVTGTAYLVIRSGGFNLGTISVDNVEMTKL